MKKTIFFLLTLGLTLVSLSSQAQNTATVANGTETNANIPIYGFYADMYIRQQIIYPADMMSAMVGSTISSMTFYLYEIPSDDWQCGFQFQLGTTNQNSFPPYPNQYLTSSFTTVYSNTLSIDASTSTMTINFTTPYTYTGGNLLLDIQNTGTGNFAMAEFYGINTNNYASAYGYNDYGDWYISGDLFIPKTTFTYSGEATCLSPDSMRISSIGIHEATLSWTPLNGQNTWRIYCDTGVVNPEQVAWITVSSDTFHTFTGLNANTRYTAYLQTDCGMEQSNILSMDFQTLNISSDFPFICDFENDSISNYWAVRNGNQSNQWRIGNAVNNTPNGSKAMYISYDNGISNAYSANAATDVWAYVDINFPDTSGFVLSFDWKAFGESCCDYLRVFIGVPVDVDANVGTTPAGATQIGTNYNNQNSWQSVSEPLPDSYANTTRRLYFLWHNDNSEGTNPPAAIDNISVTAVSCYQPDNLVIDQITATSVTVDIIPASANDSEWEICCTDANHNTQVLTTQTANNNLIGNLTPATRYNIYARTVCGEGDSSAWTAIQQFYTDCADSVSIPQIWDFEEEWVSTSAFGQNNNAPLCWAVYNGGVSNSSRNWNWGVSNSSTAAHSGTRAASCYTEQASSAHNDWLITPPIALTGSQEVSFYARRAYSTSSEPEEISVWISEENITLTAPDSSNGVLPGFIQIFQTDIPFGDYQQYHVSLVGYSGKRHIAFVRRYAPYGGYYLRLDDVSVDEAPVPADCETPTQATTLATSAHTATLSWNGGEADHFNLYYMAASDSVYSEVENISLNDTGTYILENLANNSLYHWYIAAICPDSASLNSDTISFTTRYSDPATVPYYCDFESAEENASWMIVNGSQTNQWYIDTAANHTANGNSALYISQNNGSSNSYSITSSSNVWAYRDIQFTDANEFQLSFDWRGYGESCCDYLRVYIGTPADITAGSGTSPQNALVLFNRLNLQSDWTTASVNLGHEYANSTQRLYFQWHNDNYVGTNPAAAIDNIAIEAFSCYKPAQLTISDITSTEAKATITPASGDDNLWQLRIDSLLITTTDTVYQLSNLSPAHIYNISARTICGEGDTSLWTPNQSFITACLPISTIPQNWDFESDNTGGTTAYPLPSCWDRTGSSLYPYVYNSPANAHNGNYVLYSGGDPSNYIVTLPEIDTNFLNINNLQVFFYTKAYCSAGVTSAKIELGLMSDPLQASTFIAIDSLVTLSDNYSDYILTFANAPAGNTYPALRLNATGSNNNNGIYQHALIYIDDLCLREIPNCPKPSQLEVSGINTNTATLSWENGGDETTWDIAYGAPGFNPDTAGLTITVTDNPYTLTGLSPHTNYDVYIRSNCGEETVSEWIITPVSFNTTACDTSEQCDYIFICGDGYGDGWNGAYLSIIQNGIIIANVKAMDHQQTETSTTDTIRVKLCDLMSTTFNWTSGNVDIEISLRIVDPNGRIIYDNANMSNIGSPTLLHFTSNCNDIQICHIPSQLSATNITQNSALVTWAASSGESNWEMQYKIGNINFWSYVIPIADTAQYLFTDLIPNREYHVRVKAICDDINRSEFDTVSFLTLGDGISDIELANSISLMPNPADNYIDLRVNSAMNMRKAVIYNALGQITQTIQLTGNQARIDLSGMAAGIYFVRVSGDGMSAVRKFIRR